MAPRPGGETDKLGNKYELAWAIRHALYCIRDGRRSITVEDVDADLSQGSEFTFASGSAVEVHQLKRQNGNSNSWTVKGLAGLGIFESAASHVAAGRRYHFVSLVPCRPLQELADRARRSADLTEFTQSWLSEELRAVFDQLSAAEILKGPQSAWDTLRGMWFSVQDEHDIVRVNNMLAECTLGGATGHLVSLALGDILLDNLGTRLTRGELLQQLAKQDIHILSVGSHATAREQVIAVTESWRESAQRALLRMPIERSETGQVVEGLTLNRLGLVVGTAGGGKTSILEQAVAVLEGTGAEVLALRLDRLDPFASTFELGRQLGLDTSPAAALGLAADGADAYLVIDQVDAVSLASGRMPESFDVVMDLIGEALSIAGVRVLLACRQFDIENDHRLRALAARPDLSKVDVGLLDDESVAASVAAMGLDPQALSRSQRELLRTPLHLVLLETIASQDDALAFQSRGSLFEAFWERKRQTSRVRRDGLRFNEVVARVANAVSDRQVLSVPIEILDADDLIDDANVLVSEQVLARDGRRVAFFHETFFDYAFARQWVSRGESLVEFLVRDEQELFRRAQVRQILQHLQQREPERFVEELEAMLTSADIRFHIKETALAVLANLVEPATAEVELVLRVVVSDPSLGSHVWQQLRRPQWFRCFRADGYVDSWLESDDAALRNRALNLMVSGSKEHGDEVAELLDARKGSAEYQDWVRWIVRFSDVHTNRRLFEHMLSTMRDGAFDASGRDLWLSVHDLAANEPTWAIELLQARLIDHVDALSLNQEGKVAALGIREYGAAELVRQAAAKAPRAFVDTIVPYLLSVMATTEYRPREDGPLLDKHFHWRFPESDHDERDLDDALLAGAARALETLAVAKIDEVRPLLQTLADDPHEAAQFLLYRALIAAGASTADWSAELILEGGHRLGSGYVSDGDWVSRELVAAIATHVTDDIHMQLEDLFRDLRDPYERRQNNGRTAFTFMSALNESHLTPAGVRRLGEYRRKFKEESPSPPRGITGGTVMSPIGDSATSRMTDDQWLGAMARYDKDDHDWSTFTGGARELSHQLQKHVVEDPLRFADLTLRVTSDLHPAYGVAILMGFADITATVDDPEPIFEAIRHLSSLGRADADRWLGHSLRKFYRKAPLDLVQRVLDRALNSTDPADNSPVITREGGEHRRADDLRMKGMNTARGSLSEALGDLLILDVDGVRTELVRPHLNQLADDPILSARSCVAHTIAASLRHARPSALEAFDHLIDTDDLILAAQLVQRLMLYIGDVNPEVIDPVIQRMLASEDSEAREAGGFIGAFAALEWERPELMAQALTGDVHVRTGVAKLCAGRVDRSSNAALASATLPELFNDGDDDVRKAAAEVAAHLRDHALQPHLALLEALVSSPAYEHATPQIFLTLQHAPDKMDDLALKTAQRFVQVLGQDAGDMSTSAAGDAHYISELVVRGLAQSRDPHHRSALLDVLDLLLAHGAYGIGKAIAEFERF